MTFITKDICLPWSYFFSKLWNQNHLCHTDGNLHLIYTVCDYINIDLPAICINECFVRWRKRAKEVLVSLSDKFAHLLQASFSPLIKLLFHSYVVHYVVVSPMGLETKSYVYVYSICIMRHKEGMKRSKMNHFIGQGTRSIRNFHIIQFNIWELQSRDENY